ncbi:MAG: shikimate dehydrogenase [Acidobacteria bacterium]|nr:shikimate dehydrogenase [Acidobacteriota bacterium]
MTKRIAVSITASTLEEVLSKILGANPLADFIELRLDYLQDKDLHQDSEEILKSTTKLSQKPLIFTYRSQKKEAIPNRSIQTLSRMLSNRSKELSVDYFDFDLSLNNTTAFHLYLTYQRIFNKSAKIILSHHDFEKCDEQELSLIYNRLATLNPEVIKIAAKANNLRDQLTIYSLLKTAKEEKVNLIALAMGELGQVSRILAPSWGSFLTFAAIEKGQESAPGQFTLDEMLSLYKVNSINQDTKIFCLLGYPVGHSLSPHIHNNALRFLGENAVYLPISVPKEQLNDFVKDFLHPKTRKIDWNFSGASVTIPHKSTIQNLLDEIDETAKEIGAINTIVVREDRLIGYNTDVIGAIKPLKSKINLENRKIAVLGTGGAARALIAGLKKESSHITLYGRDKEKLSSLVNQFGVIGKDYRESDKLECDLLVNTTPIGMKGWQSEAKVPIKAEVLKNCAMVYDLVYNPVKTPLLEEAERRGVIILSGLEMLITQAFEQLKLWTGLEVSTEITNNISNLLRKILNP